MRQSAMKLSGHMEFEVIEQSADRVVAEMPVQAAIRNPFGVVHAGAMMWLADVCASILVAGRTDFVAGEKGFPLGIHLFASFVANQADGVLRSTSLFVKRGRQLSIVRTTIHGDKDRLLADLTTSHVPSSPSSTTSPA